MIRVICPHCSFSRDIPADRLPDRPVQVTCPKCSGKFQFTKPAAAEPETGQAPSVPLPSQPEAEVPVLPDQPSSTPPRPRPPRRNGESKADQGAGAKPAPLAMVVLLLAAVLGAVWWLNFPSVTAIPEGAHIDRKNGFAVKAPSDWLLITPDNYKTIVSQFSDKIPKEVSRMIGSGKPGFSVSYLKIPATETEFAPNLNVVVIDTKGKNLPPLNESEKAKASEIILKEYSRALPGYKLLESRIIRVDGVDSLLVTGEADLTVVTRNSTPIYAEPGAFGLRRITGHTEAESQTYRIKAFQTMIPGKKRAYALSFMFDDLKTPEIGKLHEEVIGMFRLLERPPRFGRVVMGALNGGLFGAGLYLGGLVIGRFFRSQKKE